MASGYAAAKSLPVASQPMAADDIRIATTHVGSLPRPAELLPIIRGEQAPPADFPERLAKETAKVFAKQCEAGIDFINDGELGRRDYVTAARARLTGFGSKKKVGGCWRPRGDDG